MTLLARFVIPADRRLLSYLRWLRSAEFFRRVRKSLILLSLLTGLSLARADDKLANSDCLDCHTDPTTTRVVAGKTVPLPVFPTNSFFKSVHAKLNCTDCHNGVKELVHNPGLPPPDCTGCHE